MTENEILESLKEAMKVVKDYYKKNDPFGYDFLRFAIGLLIKQIEGDIYV